MATTQQLFIAGRWRDAQSGRFAEVANAFSGEVVTVQAAAGVADVDAAVQAAAAAFAEWSAAAPAVRRDVLVTAADALAARAEEIATAVSEETCGTFGWGMFNVALAASICRAAGALAYERTSELVASEVPGLQSKAVRRPLGVCVGIAPWNAPVILGMRAVVWALALGNTVVFKASEQSPRVHGAIVRALVEAEIPAGVVNLITNDPQDAAEVVGALVAHPGTAHVNFTGSTRVGKIIAAQAAPLLKPTLLELGGKAPLVVLDDADLDAAAAAATFGAFMNSGQICMSTERIIAARPVHDALVAKLAQRAGELVFGSPFDQGTMVGPVVNERAGEHLAALLDDARAHGAEIRIYGEESFGPVVTVLAAADDEDAVRLANDTEYGLSAAVFGADEDRAMAVAARIQSGICHVNGATVHDEAAAPFGGVKGSGWGRFGQGEVAHEFTVTRWITVSREPRHYPI
jgi:acyl-CoA reductase-like NAD-dependent aldehyde dehydrogenase